MNDIFLSKVPGELIFIIDKTEELKKSDRNEYDALMKNVEGAITESTGGEESYIKF